MSKYFHHDIEQENKKIANKLLEESRTIPIPNHQTFDELIKNTKKSSCSKKYAKIFEGKRNKIAALAACLIVLLATGSFWSVTQIANNQFENKNPSKTKTDFTSHQAHGYNEVFKAFENAYSHTRSFATTESVLSDTISAAKETAKSANDATDYSTTNVQSAGIDENDFVKTDGTYIYSVKQTPRKKIIYITKAEGTSTRTVSSITVSQLPKKSDTTEIFCGIYIYKHYLIALYTRNQYSTNNMIRESVNYNSYDTCGSSKTADVLSPSESQVIIKVYNISDAGNPKLLHTNTQEGAYVSSRMKDAYLYTVTTVTARTAFEYPTASYDKNFTSLYDENCIPKINEVKVDPKAIYVPDKIDVPGFSIATVLDVTDSSDFKNSVCVAGNCDQIYVSEDNLYLINNYDDIIDSSERENPFQQKKLKKGNQIEDNVRSMKKQIKESCPEISIKKIKEEVYRRDIKHISFINIIKFHYDKSKLTFVADNQFNGTAYNNLFFDEKDDCLRFVSSMEPEYNTGFQINLYDKKNHLLSSYYDARKYKFLPITSQVMVLDQNLNKIALIDNLAKGESLYAARYLGGYGYFVTFQEKDPLFSVDFNDMKHPKIISKLKLPGYSSYLGFYGNNLLFGFGEEIKKGSSRLKLEMYDITNGKAIQKAKQYVGKTDAYSPALDDYKQLLTDSEKNLIGFYYDDDISGNANEYILQAYYTLYTYEKEEFQCIAKIPLKDCQPDSIKGIYIGDYFYIVDCNHGIYSFNMSKPKTERKIFYKKYK